MRNNKKGKINAIKLR